VAQQTAEHRVNPPRRPPASNHSLCIFLVIGENSSGRKFKEWESPKKSPESKPDAAPLRDEDRDHLRKVVLDYGVEQKWAGNCPCFF
jgi:hypothetical protein